METNQKIKWTVLSLIITVAIIVFLFWAFPTYSVWVKEMSGKAKLSEAKYSRKIAIEEAKANLEAEKLNAKAEVERAKGLAESMRIEGGNLTDQYIKYLWVKSINEKNGNEKIYIPTEAGIPVLEAK